MPAADERQPCAGRYVHFWAADASDAFLMGFGAYVGRDGRYAGALQFKGSEESLQLPADAESFRRLIAAALPSLPRVQCFAKCPLTCQFDRLSDQLCQSLDRLSDNFAKHCATCTECSKHVRSAAL
jgi:hypothetical protein